MCLNPVVTEQGGRLVCLVANIVHLQFPKAEALHIGALRASSCNPAPDHSDSSGRPHLRNIDADPPELECRESFSMLTDDLRKPDLPDWPVHERERAEAR